MPVCADIGFEVKKKKKTTTKLRKEKTVVVFVSVILFCVDRSRELFACHVVQCSRFSQ